MIVPTLRVGMQPRTLCVRCGLRRIRRRRASRTAVPTQSVVTIGIANIRNYAINTTPSIYDSADTPMNRRKKIKQLLEAHAKKANAKLAPKSNKPRYISKADRAKLEAEADHGLVTPAE